MGSWDTVFWLKMKTLITKNKHKTKVLYVLLNNNNASYPCQNYNLFVNCWMEEKNDEKLITYISNLEHSLESDISSNASATNY